MAAATKKRGKGAGKGDAYLYMYLILKKETKKGVMVEKSKCCTFAPPSPLPKGLSIDPCNDAPDPPPSPALPAFFPPATDTPFFSSLFFSIVYHDSHWV